MKKQSAKPRKKNICFSIPNEYTHLINRQAAMHKRSVSNMFVWLVDQDLERLGLK